MSVSHDVRNGFAEGKSENALLNCVELQRLALAIERDAGSAQRRARAFELFFEGLCAITEDGLLHISQRLTGDVLHIEHFGPRAPAILVLRELAARQLGFQRDERQGVTQHVMQVARDALALSDLREPIDLQTGANDPREEHREGDADDRADDPIPVAQLRLRTCGCRARPAHRRATACNAPLPDLLPSTAHGTMHAAYVMNTTAVYE